MAEEHTEQTTPNNEEHTNGNEQTTQTNEQTEHTEQPTDEQTQKTLTQEEVNEIVQERVNKTKEKFSDYDDLKAKLDEYEKAEQERKRQEQTELENIQQDLQTKEQEKEQYREKVEQMEKQLKQDKIDQAFDKAARNAGIEYVDDAKALANLDNVEVTDESVSGIDDVVNNLVENKPFLLKQEQTQRQIGERNNGDNDKQTKENPEEILKKAAEKARNSGRTEDKIAYVNLKAELGQ